MLTPPLLQIAADEGISADSLLELVASGKVVAPRNSRHPQARPVGIGQRLRTKVNVNVGTSADFPELEAELAKVDVSLAYETDTLMDLSTGGDIVAIRREILKRATVPLGTVPIYQAALAAIDRRGSIVNMSEDDLFEAIEAQAQ